VQVEMMGLIIKRTDCDFAAILHFGNPMISTRTRSRRRGGLTAGAHVSAGCEAGALGVAPTPAHRRFDGEVGDLEVAPRQAACPAHPAHGTVVRTSRASSGEILRRHLCSGGGGSSVGVSGIASAPTCRARGHSG
jgi:hypothetical protein